MNPKYPVYIVSKGRWNSNLTSKAFDKMNIPHKIIIEKFEYFKYKQAVGSDKLLVLPQKYLENYDTFDTLGFVKSKGPGSARNYAWEHSIGLGAKRHWVLDDNINGFCRLNRNTRHLVSSGTIFRCAENFVDRYENVAQAGFEYRFFSGGCRRKKPPYRLNTRIYSCLLIKNDIPYRWRGRYNEDTDLSLRILKDGLVTVLFNAFLQNKAGTQQVIGGNTKDFYEKEGTENKSRMLQQMHPDVAEVVMRFNRVHHYVNYKPFKRNKLIKKAGLIIPDRVNNYGMKLIKIK